MNHQSKRSASSDLSISELRSCAGDFELALGQDIRKVGGEGFPWYPYGTFANLIHLDNLLTGKNRDLATLIGDLPLRMSAQQTATLHFLWRSAVAWST